MSRRRARTPRGTTTAITEILPCPREQLRPWLRRLKVLNADNELDPFWREITRMPVDPRFGSQARRRLRRHLPAALGRSRRLVGSGDGGVRRTALDTPSRDPGGIQVTRVQRERQAIPRGAPVLVSSGPSFVAGSLPETGRSRTAASGRTESPAHPGYVQLLRLSSHHPNGLISRIGRD